MFQRLFKRAETAIDQIVAKYVSLAMVAIPLLVAGGFATAALTIKLSALYGAVTGSALMAALFAVIGLVTMAIVGVSSPPEVEAQFAESEPSSAPPDTVADDVMDAADLIPVELRTALSSVVPMALPGLARGVMRNIPLIVILAIVGFIISRFTESSPDEPIKDEAATENTPPAPDVAAAA